MWEEAGPARGTVSGQVLDVASGAPVASARVALATGESVLTASDGSFTLEAPTGRQLVAVSADGYLDGGREVATGAEAWTVIFRLARRTPQVAVPPQGAQLTDGPAVLQIGAGVHARGATVSITYLDRARLAALQAPLQFLDEAEMPRRVVAAVAIASSAPPGRPTRLRVPVPRDASMGTVALRPVSGGWGPPLGPESVAAGEAVFQVPGDSVFGVVIDAQKADGGRVGYLVVGHGDGPVGDGEVLTEGEVVTREQASALVDPRGSLVDIAPASRVRLIAPAPPNGDSRLGGTVQPRAAYAGQVELREGAIGAIVSHAGRAVGQTRFAVSIADGVFEAVGTAFIVRLCSGGGTLQVAEGRVGGKLWAKPISVASPGRLGFCSSCMGAGCWLSAKVLADAGAADAAVDAAVEVGSLADAPAGSPTDGSTADARDANDGARDATDGTPGATDGAPADAGPAALSVSPFARDFGEAERATRTPPVAFRITNTGGSASPPLAVTLASADGTEPPFMIVRDECQGSLAPGASCRVDVVFAPESLGYQRGTLRIAAGGLEATAALAGTGVAAATLVITPSAHEFPATATGTVSLDTQLTVANRGGTTTGPLSIKLDGADAASFSVGAGGCPAGLVPGGTCTLVARFAPTYAGAKSASLSVSGAPGGATMATLSGLGLTAAQLALTPAGHAFEDVPVGLSSAAATFALANEGDVATGALTVELAGIDAASFALDSSCALVPAHGTCFLSVRFTPAAEGARTAVLIVRDGAQSVSAELSGLGTTGALLRFESERIDVGRVEAGGAGVGFDVRLTNAGGGPSGVPTFELGDADPAELRIETNGCMAPLDAGASCTISLRFAPRTPGARTASLVARATPGGLASASITGTGETTDALVLSPKVHSFGDVGLIAAAPATFTLRNTGVIASGTPSITVAGTDALAFSIVRSDCTGPLVPAASCTVEVAFAPPAPGARIGTLTATASPGGTALATLSGRLLRPAALSVTPATHDFGEVPLGSASGTGTFTIANTGELLAERPSASLWPAGAFRVVEDRCADGLAAGATCAITVQLAPLEPGPQAATLLVSAAPATAAQARLTGRGLVPATFVLEPPAIDFGGVPVGEESGDREVLVRNAGEVASAAPLFTIEGADPGEFDLDARSCTGPLPAGASCKALSRFRPTSAGAKGARLLASAMGAVSGSVSLAGAGGVGAKLQLSPDARDFGALPVGGASAPYAFTLTNAGDVPATAVAARVSGGLEFAVSATDCPAALDPGTSCAVLVRFAPGQLGLRGATLVASSASGSSSSAALTGTGVLAVAISPTAHDFGMVAVGRTGGEVAFDVTNALGPGASLAVALAGADAADFRLRADGCGGSPAPAGCTAYITLAPASAGPKTAELVVSAGPGGAASARLGGQAVVEARLSIAPQVLDAGDVLVGDRSRDLVATVSNDGGAASGALAVVFESTDASEWELADGCGGASLPAGGTCDVAIRFLPGARGDRAATLRIAANPGGEVAMRVTGRGLAPAHLRLDPGAYDFGQVATGTPVAAIAPLILTNEGDVPTGPVTVSVGDTTEFSFATDCTSVAPGMWCTIMPVFQPTSEGPKSATLLASALPGGSASATLIGSAWTPMPRLELSPSAGAFGGVIVGSTSGDVTFTVANKGTAPGSVAVRLSGDDGSQFGVRDIVCAAVPPAGSCDVRVFFAPTSEGPKNATLLIEGDGFGAATLTGTGVPLTSAPASGQFGEIAVGDASGEIGFVISNGGVAQLGPLQLLVEGTGAAAFEIVGASDGCSGVSLPGGASCTVGVRFVPTVVGAAAATLSAAIAGQGTLAVPLAGQGVKPATLEISPTAADFGTIYVGSSSSGIRFVVTNTGDVTTGGLSVASSNPSEFRIGASACGGQLTPGATCDVTITFVPAATGGRGATLTVSAAPGGTATATLSGAGQAVPPPPPSATVAPGFVDFGSVAATTTGAEQTFTISLFGGSPGQIPTLSVGGINSSEFRIVNDRCSGVPNFGLPCTVGVVFAPTYAGSMSASLDVVVGFWVAGSGYLQGVATPAPAALLFIWPTDGFFSVVGQTRRFEVGNNGQATSTTPNVSLGGWQQDAFRITRNDCIAPIPVNRSCFIEVQYASNMYGQASADLWVGVSTSSVRASLYAQ